MHRSHPFFAERRTRLYADPWPWLADLAAFDFSFGTRIHGNIAALLAGTPAYVLAHDSRTLELARYFEIPHTAMPDVRRMSTPRTCTQRRLRAAPARSPCADLIGRGRTLTLPIPRKVSEETAPEVRPLLSLL